MQNIKKGTESLTLKLLLLILIIVISVYNYFLKLELGDLRRMNNLVHSSYLTSNLVYRLVAYHKMENQNPQSLLEFLECSILIEKTKFDSNEYKQEFNKCH